MSHKTDAHNEQWGGARKGAGRPSQGELPSVKVQFSLAGELAEIVEANRGEDESLNQAARRLLQERIEQLGEGA